MIDAFKSFIKEKRLFSPEDKILLAVSGGVDSVVMMHLFYSCGFKFGVAHCNFQLRGKESDKDEQFVKKITKNFQANFFYRKFDTKKYAEKENISIQMAARKLRYAFFEEIRQKHKFNFISIAHHADDSSETVLLNLIRGTGIAGYHGILQKNKKIVRPLLFASKEEIMDYATENKIKWREDASNKSDDYLRNNIRRSVIPKLKEINPSFSHNMHHHISLMSETESLYREYILQLKNDLLKKNGNNIFIEISELKKHRSVATLLFELLKDYGYNHETALEIFENIDSQPGKKYLSASHHLIKDRAQLILVASNPNEIKEYEIMPGRTSFDWEKNRLILRKFTLTSDLKEEILSGNINDNNLAYLDADKIKFPLLVRTWQKADYFCPLGMQHKKLLSDYFIDNKFSLAKKEKTWLLVSGNDICWVIGERNDDRYKITEDSSTCLQLTIEKL
ncbi:MAG: tRNA lysidine(34) synthetase TilS [Bacteroidia bacterium]